MTDPCSHAICDAASVLFLVIEKQGKAASFPATSWPVHEVSKIYCWQKAGPDLGVRSHECGKVLVGSSALIYGQEAILAGSDSGFLLSFFH